MRRFFTFLSILACTTAFAQAMPGERVSTIIARVHKVDPVRFGFQVLAPHGYYLNLPLNEGSYKHKIPTIEIWEKNGVVFSEFIRFERGNGINCSRSGAMELLGIMEESPPYDPADVTADFIKAKNDGPGTWRGKKFGYICSTAYGAFNIRSLASYNNWNGE